MAGGEPKAWIPGTKAEPLEPLPADELFKSELDNFAETDEKTLMVLTEVDLAEKYYLDEYHKVFKKDKEDNKDLNKLALQELKSAHLFFAYMKTSEKLYNMELKKKEEAKEEARIAAMTPQEKIQEVNEDIRGKANKILDSVKNPNAGR